MFVPPDDTWSALVVGWLSITPLWAVATAWLSRAEWTPSPPASPTPRLVEAWRISACLVGAGLLVALAYLPAALTSLWLRFAGLAWLLTIAADVRELGRPPVWTIARRGLAAGLTFLYVCLAWIFFRATDFDHALAVLRQLADGSLGHANVTQMVEIALAVSLLCHLWGDATFRWMRDRFTELPPIAQGALLATAALALRELSHAKLVKFIYFEF